MLSFMFSVILVDTLSFSNLVNDSRIDRPIDRKILSNAEEAGQHHYRLRKSKEWIDIVRRNFLK